MRRCIPLAAAVLWLSAASAFSQSSVSSQGTHRMEITLERLENRSWKVIEPALVLDSGDRVRFRFRANFDGYLYVTNSTTSAESTLLFPRRDTGTDNRVVAGREYLIPSSDAFRVSGPAGHDIVSWLVSPAALGPLEPPARDVEALPPDNLTPRCDDSLFRARGMCLDASAGPQAKKEGRDREDLMVIRKKKQSVISPTAPLKAPMVYEFRLAHK